MLIGSLLTIQADEKAKYSSMNSWIMKIWYIFTMGYNSAVKKYKIKKLIGNSMELEIIIKDKVTQPWRQTPYLPACL